jgi:hypothetical protein
MTEEQTLHVTVFLVEGLNSNVGSSSDEWASNAIPHSENSPRWSGLIM